MAYRVGTEDWESLLERMTMHDLEVHRQMARLFPTGDFREDLRHADLVAWMISMFSSEPVKVEDVLGWFQEVARKQKTPTKSVGPKQAAKIVQQGLNRGNRR